MKSEIVNEFMDKMTILSASFHNFKTLSEKQKIIGATEHLIGTTTRSGIEAFFDSSNEYLWKDALLGLQGFGAINSIKYYKKVLQNLKEGRKDQSNFKKLQHELTVEDFELIHAGVRKLAKHELNLDL